MNIRRHRGNEDPPTNSASFSMPYQPTSEPILGTAKTGLLGKGSNASVTSRPKAMP